MALIFSDRVKDTTVTSGTGTITLSGTAPTGYQTFGTGVGNANTCYYCIASQTLATWEVGLGTYTSSGTTLSRTAGNVLSGSSGAGTLVSFGSETKDVFVTSPALWATAPAFTGNVTTLGQLGVGTTTLTNGYASVAPTQSSTAAQFYVGGTNTNAGSTLYGAYFNPTITGTATSFSTTGISNVPVLSFSAGATVANAISFQNITTLAGTVTPTSMTGILATTQLNASATGGTITYSTAVQADSIYFNSSATTNISNAYGFYASNITKGAAQTIGTAYGFYGNQGTGSATSSWNLYMAGAAPNYLNSNLLIGTTTVPTTASNIVFAGLVATSAAAPTIASATTIAPTKPITFISGTTAIATITAPNPISTGGGQITLLPTGAFTTTTAGNIALASTAVVNKALIMTYDTTTAKWYPSY